MRTNIDWVEVMHISRWYTGTNLRCYARMLGGADIVSEAMLSLVKLHSDKWSEFGLTTIVCNQTRWAALKLSDQHKKHSKLDGHIAFSQEFYSVDFCGNLFAEDVSRMLSKAKSKVIGDLHMTLGKRPTDLSEKARWNHLKRHILRRIERYESGLFERKVTECETLQTLGDWLGVSVERARNLDSKFWREIRLALSCIYEISLDGIYDLLVVGEIRDKDDQTDVLQRRD